MNSFIWIIPIFIAVAFVWFAFVIFTKRGREMSLYGGKVIETVGQIEQSTGVIRSSIRVLKVQKRNKVEPVFVVETTRKMPLAFSIDVMKFNRDEANEMAKLLQKALQH